MSSNKKQIAKQKAKLFQTNSDDPSTWEYIKSDRLRKALQGAAGYQEPAPTISPTFPKPDGKVTEPSDTATNSAPRVETTITPQTIEFDPSQALYYGDSVATGYGHRGSEGNSNSDARWGRGAERTLEILRSRPESTFKDKDVVLSSGVLNSGLNLDIVRQQIEVLQKGGAKSIRLLGAPETGKRFAGYNEQLRKLSAELDVIFPGGYSTNDGVHPDDYTKMNFYKK